VIAGEAVGLIHGILSASAIVHAITTEADALLTRGHMCSREKTLLSSFASQRAWTPYD